MELYATKGDHPENRKFAVFFDYSYKMDLYRIIDLDYGEIWPGTLDTEEDAIKTLDLFFREYTLYRKA